MNRLLFCLLIFFFSSLFVFADECVVVLHGLGRTYRSMIPIENALLGEGYRVVNRGYLSKKFSIENLVENAVSPAVLECEGAQKVHFVTHSLGGILVRYYLEHNALVNLGHLVMIAPPNAGSELVSSLGWFPPMRWIMGPAFLQLSRRADSIPNQLPIPDYSVGVIIGTRSVNPLFSWLVPGKDDGKVSIESARMEGKPSLFIPASHSWIMRKKEVKSEILHFLKTGHFSRSE